MFGLTGQVVPAGSVLLKERDRRSGLAAGPMHGKPRYVTVYDSSSSGGTYAESPQADALGALL